MDTEKRTEIRVSDTPETDSKRFTCSWTELASLCERLERERNLALKIARKYYNGPEVRNFPNVKV